MLDVCFACKKIKKLTSEHIIPQSLGGKLSKKLYCKECNNAFGAGIDKELSVHVGHIATILQIKRARGKNQPIEMEDVNKKVKLVFDGDKLKRKKPIINKETDGNTLISADIIARSKEELESIINSIKANYEVPYQFEFIKVENSGPSDLAYYRKLDNKLLRRAVAKIAYSLLCTKAQKEIALSTAFDRIRKYIIFENEDHMATANFIHTKFMTDYTRPLHKIHISYNRSEHILAGFVSLFGIYRFTVLLSDCFQYPLEWPDLDYTYDPVRLAEVPGKDSFRARALTINDILHPKQSKEFVEAEIKVCHNVIGSYVDSLEFIDSKLD